MSTVPLTEDEKLKGDDKIDAIVDQSKKQIQACRDYKNGKVTFWRLNEELYYGVKRKALESRASVQLSRMQEFVHTLLSKIDNPLVFKFKKRKNSQTKRVDRLNALRQIDQENDSWDIKDIVGKKQGIIYGRAVYAYFADSIGGKYKAHLSPIDVYEFLIDPACGGIDIEEARCLGSYDVVMDRKELKKLLDKPESEGYRHADIVQLLEGNGNANAMTVEQVNQQYRSNDVNTVGRREGFMPDKDKYKFWRWFTTWEGERYYLLMTDDGTCVRCCRMKDVLPSDGEYEEGMWPFWTWAAFPDLTEFWTPSYCDYVREIFMAQDVSVNQMIDNAEAINKPMKLVDVNAIENLAQLKYRRDGIIPVKSGTDVQKAIQFVQTPSINTPMELFQLLETIQEKASGVTSQSKGVEDVQGKVGIYEGNQAAAADRFGLLNKSYSFGYKRFAKLWEMGVRDNLVRRVAVEIMGPAGVEIEEVNRRDLFKKGDCYGVMVEASNAETLANEQTKATKIAFLQSKSQMQPSTINAKKAAEMEAEIAGFSQEQIDDLMDLSVYGTSDQLADADADIEAILHGDVVRPNRKANNAYKQHIVNFMGNHDRDLSTAEFMALTAYVDSLTDTIMANEARALQEDINRSLDRQALMGPAPMARTPSAAPGIPGPSAPMGVPAPRI